MRADFLDLVTSAVLSGALDIKWMWDRAILPLTPEHKELYRIIHRKSWRELKKFPNLIRCSDFNDRMQWLKLFDQSEDIVRCSDKILVRDYINERIGDQYLVKLYQVCDHFHEIDFEKLPHSFVIKTNHDSGTVFIVNDKSTLDRQKVGAYVELALARAFGWLNGEWAYSYIVPKVFVEELIGEVNSAPPADYKFFCVDGNVKFCHFICDRGKDTKEQTVDRFGNDLATELYPAFKLSTEFKKPGRWDEMIAIAEQLSSGFKFVRVDMYFVDNRIYAGEMTFWPMAGFYKGEGQKVLGRLLNFDRASYRPFVLAELEKKVSRSSIYAYHE